MMTKQEAITYLRKILENFTGTWADHQKVQEALKVLEDDKPN